MQITSTTNPVTNPTMATTTAATTTTGATSGAPQKTLGQNDFLRLISVQLASQDPMKPMEDTAFIAQMANFTSLEQMKTLTNDFAAFSQAQRADSAQFYLGKQVTVTDAQGAEITGAVTAVHLRDGSTPKLTVNGADYGLDAVRTVVATSPAS